ncbi:TonB-dependent receptor [Brevundimonas sp.]|uniref:TonB-dependent receptor n=1 Tax=Brevundimonas sp. TaxID=1871086 RepID=UPI0035AE4F2E
MTARRALASTSAIALLTAVATPALAQPQQDDVTVLDEIVVQSQRIAQEDALANYRRSDAIANYVAADDVGQFVDQNVAESLSRLPGVSITRDQGEGRFVSVRGVPPGLSTVTINGMRIGTPEAGDRAVPLDVIPAGSIDLLEIVKVPTPDMPGDAVGGAIDVRSGSPFDESRRQNFRYRVEGSYAELSEDWSPDLRLNFSDVFSLSGGAPDFGVSAGVNFVDRNFQSDNIEAVYDFNDDLGDDVFVIEEIDARKYFVNRERFGANLNLEYRPSGEDTFYANGLFSRFKDAETRQRSGFVFADGEVTAVEGDTVTWSDIPEDAFRRRIRFRTKEQETFALSAGGEHVRGLWTIEYQLGHSITDENVADEVEGRFENDVSGGTANVTYGRGIPSFTIDNPGYLDNANYVLDRAVIAPIFVDDNDTNLTLDVTRADAFMPGLTIKAGLDYRTKDKDSDPGEAELRDVPDARLDQFTSSGFNYPFHPLGDGISSGAFVDFFNQGGFAERPQDAAENLVLLDAEDFQATEDVTAGYLMGTWDNGPWRVIAGARVENTQFDADGNQLTFDENGDLSLSSRSVSTDYTNVLPGVHVRYEPTPDLVIRAAWSNTIARPSFSDISPRAEINTEDLEIEAGNPELDPYESANLDLMIDWYAGSGSVVSFGVFSKDIDGFIVERNFQDDAEFPGFDVTRPVNGTEASIRGLEFNVQQDLGVWSGAMQGLLVGANLTLLDSEFTVDGRSDTFSLPQTAEETANLYVGYERGGFSGRLSYAFRGEYLEEIGDDENFDLFVRDSQQLDFTASYRITPAVEVLFEAQNLLNDPLELYQGEERYTFQFEEYGRTFAVGLKGRF